MITIPIFAIIHVEGGIKEDTTFHTTRDSAYAALAALRSSSSWGDDFHINAYEARVASEPVTHLTYHPLTDYGYTWPAGIIAHDGTYTNEPSKAGTLVHVFPQRVGRDEEQWVGWESIGHQPRRDDI